MPFSRLLLYFSIRSTEFTARAAGFARGRMMYGNFRITLAMIVVAGLPLHLKATPQAPSSEALTPSAVRELEKSAQTASDHETTCGLLSVSGSDRAEKPGRCRRTAEEMGSRGNAPRRPPDPYPHARRLVSEYSAQVEKYSKLAANHDRAAQKLQAGGNSSSSGPTTTTPKH